MLQIYMSISSVDENFYTFYLAIQIQIRIESQEVKDHSLIKLQIHLQNKNFSINVQKSLVLHFLFALHLKLIPITFWKKVCW